MTKLSQGEIDALFSRLANGDEANVPALDPAPGSAPVQEPGPGRGPGSVPGSGAAPGPAPGPAPAAFPVLEQTQSSHTVPASIGLLAGVELEVTVRLGRTHRSIRELLSLGSGSLLELDNLAGETVDVLVNGRLLARGEVVVVGENYGVRLVELIRSGGGSLV